MHGCLILLERWGQLDEILTRSGNWKESQQGMALDLLGISHALRDNGTILDVPEGVTPKEHLQGIVRAQVKELETRCEQLADEADSRREHACQGLRPRRRANEDAGGVFDPAFRQDDPLLRAIRPGRSQGAAGNPVGDPEKEAERDLLRVPGTDVVSGGAEAPGAASAGTRRSAGERERKLEAERLAALENPPQYHEGLPMEEFIRRVNEWKARRDGKLPEPPVEPTEPPLAINATLAGAMPQPPEPEDGPRIEFLYPASDDDSDTTTEENQDDRHDE